MPVLFPLIIPAPGKQCTGEVLQGWGNFAGESRATTTRVLALGEHCTSPGWLPPALVPSALITASSRHALKEMPDAYRGEHSLSLSLSYSERAEHPGRTSFLRGPPSHPSAKHCLMFLLAKAVRKMHPEQAMGCRLGQRSFNTPAVERCYLQRFNLACPQVPSTPMRFHCLKSVLKA